MGETHGVTSQTRVDAELASQVAALMTGLAATSRVQILGRLREGACNVTDLCAAVQMTQPAVSQQLRILRSLHLVAGTRSGRQTIYGLHDPHVAVLLDEALRHLEHLREPATTGPPASSPTSNHATDGASMTDEHTHTAPHTHEHEHDGDGHVHPHASHEHTHVEHEHEHEHDGDVHTHTHVHEVGLEEAHEHAHEHAH